MALLVALWSAVATEAFGVHALFGAFFAGLMMPRDAVLEAAPTDGVEPLTKNAAAAPVLRVHRFAHERRLIDSRDLCGTPRSSWPWRRSPKAPRRRWPRVMGIGWRDASALGILLNTRGLIELVILNIGYETGILSPLMFSMMVVMALVTTAVASPLRQVVRPLTDRS